MVDEEAGVYLVLLPSAPPMAITVGSVSICQYLIVSWDAGRFLVKTRGWTPFHRLEPPVSCHPFE